MPAELFQRFVLPSSPRRSLRIDTRSDNGWSHAYGATIRLARGSVEPDGPYAMYLADSSGQYRFLAFDFDGSRGDVASDVAVLIDLLAKADIPAAVVASGSPKSRHVWVACPRGLPAGFVRNLARAAALRLPTLDTAPLTNPQTGCVRPPGAPHRNGGRAEVFGDVEAAIKALTQGVEPEAVERLAWLLGVNDPVVDSPPVIRASKITVDGAGHPHIPGVLKAIGAKTQGLIDAPITAGEDAHPRLWQILTALARRRWTFGKVQELAARQAPGFEHVYSAPDTSRPERRVPRAREHAEEMLARQWSRAVDWVAQKIAEATTDVAEDPDSELAARSAATAAAIAVVQERADAAIGRWAHGGGPSDRRVLDQLCLYAAQARTTVLEADNRRLALDTGISRETARKALKRLAGDGWVEFVGEGQGINADVWALSTPKDDPGLSQGAPRPATGCPHWTEFLGARMRRVSHDVFTYGYGLGHVSGQIFNALVELTQAGTKLVSDNLSLAAVTGHRPTTVWRKLTEQVELGLAERCGTGYRTGAVDLDTAARRIDAAGVRAARTRLYTNERAVWDWWNAELRRMRQKRSQRAQNHHRRRPPPGQAAFIFPGLPLWGRFDRFPRRPGGRADLAAARREIRVSAEPQVLTAAR